MDRNTCWGWVGLVATDNSPLGHIMTIAERKELIRTATRPALLWMMVMGSFFFLMEGIAGTWVDVWVGTTLGAVGEWILERPILKVFNKA